MNSFNECTHILRSSEIKNKSEKEEKVELTGCCICGVHFCCEADTVLFAFSSPPLLKPWSLFAPSLLFGAPGTALCLLCCHISSHQKVMQTSLQLCIASPFPCYLSKEICNSSISNLYFRFYKSSCF